MMVVHISSPDGQRDLLYLSKYAKTQIIDRLARIDGVGEARVFAEREYSLRSWLHPELMTARNLAAREGVEGLRGEQSGEAGVGNGVVEKGRIPGLPGNKKKNNKNQVT